MNMLAVQNTSDALPATHETVAAVAHDLKLPLSHIKGFVSSLRRDDMTWDDDTRQEFLAEIEQEVDRLAQMVDCLMHARQKGAGREQAKKLLPTNPASIVNRAVQRTQHLLGARPLRVEVAPGLPRVRVDACQIERVLLNLLQNAVKYTSPRTPITVCARMQGPNLLELAVEDGGPGIPMEDQNRVFEPFFRTETVALSTVPGHGLGLAICQSIALAHGGRMGITSRPGRTRFSMYLPLDKTKNKRPKYATEMEAA
jgi:two-component system, OmpR family, sensor histidine kinase KdpD